MQLKPGTLLQGGKYQIKKILGQGGFGITYLAEHTRLHNEVAIKEFFMKDHCNRDTESSTVTVPSLGSDNFVRKFKAKFLKEAQMIADMDNRHIIKVVDVFEDYGTAYYVMEYLRCGSLTDRIPESGLPEKEALKYIRQVAEALSYIHNEKNVVHLDVKPSNIMFRNDDEAVLIDFGISKHYDDDGGQQTTTTSSPAILSRWYAPLEQYKPGGVAMFAPCTDIYSLGATLYKLLTGQNPPDANDVNEYGIPPLPASVSQSVRDAVKKAMSPLRKDRPQSVGEFLKLLPQDIVVADGGNKPPRPKYGRWVIACLVACVAAMAWLLWPDNTTGSGVLVIETQPTGAVVNIVDNSIGIVPNQSIGSTPLQKTLPAGEYDLKISKPGYGDIYETVTVGSSIYDTVYVEHTFEEMTKPVVSSTDRPNDVYPDISSQNAPSPQSTVTPVVAEVSLDVLFAKAQTIEDYRYLADRGYVKAYVKLAELYLKENDYEDADYYAKKALKAKVDTLLAERIVDILNAYGYYKYK